MRRLFKTFLLSFLSVFIYAQPGAHDPTFNPGTGANGEVKDIAIQSDGKIILGGSFTQYNGVFRRHIARLNTNGIQDATYTTGTGAASDYVETISIQSDGKAIIGGRFIEFEGTPRNYIARLDTNGLLDNSFNPGAGATDWVLATAIQSDGKIIIAGQFTNYNGTNINRIARLNTNGSLDLSFNPGLGANNSVHTVAIQSDGKIIIGGDFSSYDGTTRNNVARLNTNGSLDGTFTPGLGANNFVRGSAIQTDGKIILVGNGLGPIGGNIVRLNTDGSLDGGFNTGSGANGSLNAIAIQSDGKIIVGGDFTNFNGTPRIRILRLNTDGSVDSGFLPGASANNYIKAIAIQSDGKIIIGGGFTTYNGVARSGVARLFSCTSTTFSQTFNECPGFSVTVGSSTYTTTGVYTNVLTNAAGCDSTVTTNLTIGDAIAPTITCPGNIIVYGPISNCAATASWTVPSVTDNCNPSPSLVATHNPGSSFPVGVTTVTYTASDTINTLIATQDLLYFDNTNSNLRMFNYNGSNADTIPLTGTITVTAINRTTGKLYRIGGSTIVMSDVDGSNPTTIVSGINDPSDMEIDINAGYIFWSEYTGQRIRRANLDGTNQITLANTPLRNFGLGLDKINQKVYAVYHNSSSIAQIFSVNYTGGAITNIGGTLPGVYDVAVANNKVYYTRMAVSIHSRDLSTLADQLLVSGANAASIVLNEAGTEIFWREQTLSEARKCDINGANITTIATGIGAVSYIGKATGLPLTIPAANRSSCSFTVTVIDTVNHNFTQNISLCAGQSISVGANTYNATGNYIDTIPSMNGCDSIITTNLTVNTTTAAITGTNTICSGASTTFTATGGTSFAWSNAANTAATTVSTAGTYTVTVTDGNGCTATSSRTLTVNANPTAAITGTNTICSGASTTFTATGGTSFAWSNSANTAATTVSTAGTYSVTVTDANGCTATDSRTLTVNANPTVSATSVDAICTASNGTATATANGGTAPYNYLWNNGATDATAVGLSANAYTVTVTDVNGCQSTASAVVATNSGNLSLSASATQELCTSANGSATVATTGGTAPFSFLWNDGQTDATALGLSAGAYTATVTDANGCADISSITVGTNSGALSATTGTTDATCLAADGTATATPANGSAPFDFVWNNGQTNATAAALTAGTYNVTITDADGCVTTAIATVAAVNGGFSAAATASNAICTSSNGTATATANTGTAPLSYVWNNGATTSAINALSAGTYDVTITDANGCVSTASATVGTDAGNLSSTVSATDATANGAADGTVDVTVTGGTTPITYLWSNGATTEDLNAVAAGTYDVTITDANGCISTASATVSQPPVAVVSTANNWSVKLFPNPADNQTMVAVELGTASNVRIRLVNSLGQVIELVEYSDVSNVQHSLDVSELPAAIYMVEITTNGVQKVQRLVVCK